ncbi:MULTISPECIES: thioesterase [Cyanophyceae]|uniref:thioesterase II family protein n=1 Tax=Cyanophyceae TaxID=3028117 RepID=UPI00168552A0|nr:MULTISPECIES: thioesterase [Cyanophyceae]MBD1915174.1 thioesterase [Phormidium sp. FACHB-77]MBD2028438.1 thioesterase [Phormidium sp. FACHB-322]MBD2051856.1 thioesterase [Leptolyngbya sp. FACHB-60]
MPATHLNAWFKCLNPSSREALRLFCFPYAGGNSAIFRPWLNQLPASAQIELCPLHLPGREARLRELLVTDLAALVQTLSQALQPHLDQPFAFFGHSLGALISFELARQLQAQGAPLPLHLFVSGCRAPQLLRNKGLHTLPDQALLAELQALKGTPQQVLNNPELMQWLLPTLRADFSIFETYIYHEQRPLACDISVFGGLNDLEAPAASLPAWRQHTSLSFSQHVLPGDHFFLHTHYDLMLKIIADRLKPAIAAKP